MRALHITGDISQLMKAEPLFLISVVSRDKDGARAAMGKSHIIAHETSMESEFPFSDIHAR